MRILVLFLFLLAGGCTAPSTGDPAGCGLVARATLPLGIDRGLPIVPVVINDRAALLVLDTGADGIVLVAAAAGRLDLPAEAGSSVMLQSAGGETQTISAVLHRLMLGNLVVSDHRVPLLPQQLPLLDNPPPDGLLGTSVLSMFEVELDFPHRLLRLHGGRICAATRAPGWPAPFSSVDAIATDHGRLVIPVDIDGYTLTALVDTGTQVSVISTAAALAAGVDQAALARDPAHRITDSGSHTVAARLHRFHTLGLGDEILPDRTLIVVDRPPDTPDIVLGMDILGDRAVWLSYARRRVFIEPAAK